MNTQQNSQPAAISNSHSFNVSLFNNKNDNVAKPEKHSWDSLVEILKKPDIRNHKDGRLISGATFKDFKRSKSNAVESSLLILDFDHVDKIDLSVWQRETVRISTCYPTFKSNTRRQIPSSLSMGF